MIYSTAGLRAMSRAQLAELIGANLARPEEALLSAARAVREAHYGKRVFFRGLIEFSNYCKNDCYYCGIRRGNARVRRYRLSEDAILACCELGYELGYRSFVLQSGEDAYYTVARTVSIVSRIRARFAECAITLSMGEKDRAAYQAYFDAGANRYLLRHESANAAHYAALHPPGLTLEHRIECLYTLRDIGYHVGAGFMVGSPGQTRLTLADDLLLLRALEPDMIGIGPFIPQCDTPFARETSGTVEATRAMLALARLMVPRALIPSTTALGSIDPNGRELGLQSGANVVMPNLSPTDVRADYKLYDGKISTGDEAAECRRLMEVRIRDAGFEPDFSRGDRAGFGDGRAIP